MKVVEIFNSIDGEGKRAGELTTFIRLFGCNLNCSYCDSRYACENTEENITWFDKAIEDILAECTRYGTRNITVTGGEPLIHKDIKYLLSALSKEGYDVNVETNGSISLAPYFDSYGNILKEYENVWFTIDYKCGTSNMSDKMCSFNFTQYYANTVYKFVVGSLEDLNQANKIMKDILEVSNRGNFIYLSPVFGQIEPRQIVEYMQANNLYNSITPIKVQLQLHKFIWDPNKKGV